MKIALALATLATFVTAGMAVNLAFANTGRTAGPTSLRCGATTTLVSTYP